MSRGKVAPKIRTNFIGMMVRHSPNGSKKERMECAEDMLRIAATYGRIQEVECNRELTQAERAREAKCAEKLREIASDLGVGLKLGGDPRGYTVKVLFPLDADGRRPYNTWGGMEEGWGVPTS